MNAAFLLVTSAWLAGQSAPPTTAKPAPVTAAAPAVSSSCGCNTCNSCCEEESFWDRLRARFRSHRCEDQCSTCSTCSTTTHWAPAPSCGCDPCEHRFGERLRGWFSRHNDCGCEPACGCGSVTAAPSAPKTMAPAGGEKLNAPKPTSELPAKELPRGASAPPTLDLTPTASKPLEETKNPFELDRRYQARVDRAADYSWLTGQLFYVHADGGLWVLRYAPIWKEEANGGSVVLAREVPMDSYREGDLVQVRGEILQSKASSSLGGPLYHVQSIELKDRPAQ